MDHDTEIKSLSAQIAALSETRRKLKEAWLAKKAGGDVDAAANAFQEYDKIDKQIIGLKAQRYDKMAAGRPGVPGV